jgi:hypothetical protein
MMMKRVCLLILSLCLGISCWAGDWNSFIINYPKNVYGKGSQTWQINPYNGGWMYFANKNGLVQFNGSSWTMFPLHNGLDVRSVNPSVADKRIYVGGINEFGYFAPDKNGRLVYTCLSDRIKIRPMTIGNVWNILESEGAVYFQGDGEIWKYVDGHFSKICLGEKIDCSGLINGAVFIGTEKGVFVLVGNTFLPLREAESLNHKRIRAILPYGKAALFVTAFDGVFIYNGQTTRPFTISVESFLKQNEVFSAAISRDNIALGTIRRGLVIINLHTRAVKYLSEMNGMQNNTGKYDATEVAQLYVQDVAGSVTRPVKELKGFQRVSLKSGEKKSLAFDLPVSELAFYGLDMKKNVEPGDFRLWVSGDSNSGAALSFKVE